MKRMQVVTWDWLRNLKLSRFVLMKTPPCEDTILALEGHNLHKLSLDDELKEFPYMKLERKQGEEPLTPRSLQALKSQPIKELILRGESVTNECFALVETMKVEMFALF